MVPPNSLNGIVPNGASRKPAGKVQKQPKSPNQPKSKNKRAERNTASVIADAVSNREFGSSGPTISQEFNEAIYLALNPDIVDAIADGRIKDAYTHWSGLGRKETERGDRPSLFHQPQFPANRWQQADLIRALADPECPFDAESYLYLNGDLRHAVAKGFSSPAQHWRDHGQQEGRVIAGSTPFRARVASATAIRKRPFGVNVFGSLAALSGLGTVARGMVQALAAAGVPFELWNHDSRSGFLQVAESDRARRPRYRINLLLVNADNLAALYAALPPGFLDDAYNIGLWQWELPAFRPDWFPAFGGVDEVWTNSEFQRTSFDAVAPVPVVTIHTPVVPEPSPRRLDRSAFGIPDDTFAFLCAFDIGSTTVRKNPLAAVEAFVRAFGDTENVVLVLKFHSVRHEPSFLATLNDRVKAQANIVLIATELPPSEMADLRAVCNCLLSPHRSEGFGLNVAEFMALGKPVIATRYSGNNDFLDDDTGFPVAFQLSEVLDAAGPYRTGNIWAEPNLDDLAAQMRRVCEQPAEVARRGAIAVQRMSEAFSYETVGRAIMARLTAIGLDRGDGPFAEWIGQSPGRAVFRSVIAGVVPRHRSLAGMASLPMLSLVVPVYNVPGPYLKRCIRSVLEQTYPYWELCICDDGSSRPDTLAVLAAYKGVSPKIKIRRLPGNSGIASASNAAAEMATGEYLAMLDNDDELLPDALWEAANAIAKNPAIDCLYTDEDKIDEVGNQLDHFLKPDWSPEHIESVMYVLHMLVVRKSLFLKVGQFRPEYDGAQDYDLMLRCSRHSRAIHHVRRVLYRWRAIAGSAAAVVDAKPGALLAGYRALQDHARHKYGPDAKVENGLLPGTFRLRRPLRRPPPVTLLILTNNAEGTLPGRGPVCFITNLVASILERTDYPSFEIVVVDNSSLSTAQKLALAELSVRVENFDNPPDGFNFAAKANYAARCARTDHVVFLNDDMEVIAPDWLTSLLELLQDLEVGGVGARLLHFDGTVQHVGMALGVHGSVAHLYHSFPGQAVGYNGFTHIIRNYSTVTGACFATRRSILDHVGGFDEAFAIDYNDIDLCLRMRAANYRIAYTPYALLYHFEQASAPRTSQNPAERQLFMDRWAAVIEDDPFYNPNLTRDSLDFALREPHREFG